MNGLLTGEVKLSNRGVECCEGRIIEDGAVDGSMKVRRRLEMG